MKISRVPSLKGAMLFGLRFFFPKGRNLIAGDSVPGKIPNTSDPEGVVPHLTKGPQCPELSPAYSFISLSQPSIVPDKWD
jgi:hypothetical protein